MQTRTLCRSTASPRPARARLLFAPRARAGFPDALGRHPAISRPRDGARQARSRIRVVSQPPKKRPSGRFVNCNFSLLTMLKNRSRFERFRYITLTPSFSGLETLATQGLKSSKCLHLGVYIWCVLGLVLAFYGLVNPRCSLYHRAAQYAHKSLFRRTCGIDCVTLLFLRYHYQGKILIP